MPSLGDAARGQRGIRGWLRVDTHPLSQELTALRQGLRMRVDACDLVEGRTRYSQQAVFDLEHFLADDRHVETEQEVVDFVHRSRRAVLDGQNRLVRIPPLHCLQRLAE